MPIDTLTPEGRGLFMAWLTCSRFLTSLTVHCTAHSRRLRTPIVAMVLETLATSQPYRLGDLSYVTIKTGENY